MPVAELNCHPFVAGPLAFMHNGYVAGFEQLRLPLVAGLSAEAFNLIQGTTDSEHLMAVYWDRWRQYGDDEGVGALVGALEYTLEHIEQLRRQHGIDGQPRLNMAVTDGRCAVVSRYGAGAPERAESLYVHHGKAYVCDGDRCKMVEPGPEGGTVLVASEPLSADEGWTAVSPNHLVIVNEDRAVQTRPCSPSSEGS